MQLLINIIQDNNWVITTKNGKGILTFFHGNREQLIPIYARQAYSYRFNPIYD